MREIFLCFEIIYIKHISSHSISQKFRYHANKTFSSDLYIIRMKMSYSHDVELFERNFMDRIMSYLHDFETTKNLSHKYIVLFNGHSAIVIILRGGFNWHLLFLNLSKVTVNTKIWMDHTVFSLNRGNPVFCDYFLSRKLFLTLVISRWIWLIAYRIECMGTCSIQPDFEIILEIIQSWVGVGLCLYWILYTFAPSKFIKFWNFRKISRNGAFKWASTKLKLKDFRLQNGR